MALLLCVTILYLCISLRLVVCICSNSALFIVIIMTTSICSAVVVAAAAAGNVIAMLCRAVALSTVCMLFGPITMPLLPICLLVDFCCYFYSPNNISALNSNRGSELFYEEIRHCLCLCFFSFFARRMICLFGLILLLVFFLYCVCTSNTQFVGR